MLTDGTVRSFRKTLAMVALMVPFGAACSDAYRKVEEPAGRNKPNIPSSSGAASVAAKLKIGDLVTGVFRRYENSAAVIMLRDHEAILPRKEQIPGETYKPNDLVRGTVCDVREASGREEVVVSRIRAELIGRLFEQEVPELVSGIVEIKATAREPGNRTKIAVSSNDPRIDCIGACVGVRGSRIKNVVDQLAGERIDVVRYSDDAQVLVRNAVMPAAVERVLHYPMLGRAVAIVLEEQRALAVGNHGENVRLSGELCGLKLEIMTEERLADIVERAVVEFRLIEGIDMSLAEKLAAAGLSSNVDLATIKSTSLMKVSGLSEEQADLIIARAKLRIQEPARNSPLDDGANGLKRSL